MRALLQSGGENRMCDCRKRGYSLFPNTLGKRYPYDVFRNRDWGGGVNKCWYSQSEHPQFITTQFQSLNDCRFHLARRARPLYNLSMTPFVDRYHTMKSWDRTFKTAALGCNVHRNEEPTFSTKTVRVIHF